MPVHEQERTHTQIWERIGHLESDVSILAERLEVTKELVLSNQKEQRDKLDILDRGMNTNTIVINRVDERISTGSKVITWMFGAGITLMMAGIGVIGLLLT